MSQIASLTAQLAPGGVPYRTLEELGTIVRGKRFVKDDMVGAGVPCIHYGEIYTKYGTSAMSSHSFVTKERARTLRFARPGDVIMASAGETIEDIGKSVAWLGEEPVAIHDACYSFSSDNMNPEFVSYFFSSRHFRDQLRQHISSSKISSVSTRAVARARIPAPPLQVQHEVVRILDKFSKLEAELEAELEARRKQHAFYWGGLLHPQAGWVVKALGDVVKVFDGPHATPRKTSEGPWYLSISSLKGGRFDLTESAHLSEEEFSKWTRRVEARRGDTMFSYETRLGEAAFWDSSEPAALGRRMGLLRPRPGAVVPRFLTLAYLGPAFQELIRSKTVSGSTVDRIPIANMKAWPLALPPLDEQERIVEVLEKFDALVNDLRIGLPAELAARRKQYEYYRDKLLTFEESQA